MGETSKKHCVLPLLTDKEIETQGGERIAQSPQCVLQAKPGGP